ncbi:MAG: class I tRNA ligase family protein, partial [Sedimentisphaerales bacterium]|nr:class I tRNA ligase family protein [Sedimentisphaerales bacterium]
MEHEYPFCWRCGAPLIYFARRAWFFEVSRLRKELLERNERINWVPPHLKEGRFGEWLKDAKDWAISRERYWGAPLPIWRCADCKEIKVAGSLAELEEADYFKNRFYFVRHTEADHIVSGLIASGPEAGKHISHLTKKGNIAGEGVAKKLAKEKIDVIYASPYTRTKELAEIINKATGAKIIFDDRLVELNTGPFNWGKVSAYRKFFDSEAERYVKAPPGAETLTDVRRRTMSFAKDINQEHRGKKIVVVGHGDPLWILEGMFAGKTKEESFKYPYIKLGEIRKCRMPNLPVNDVGEVDIHRPYADKVILECDKCGGRAERVKEVADVWFDSGAMPFAQDHFPFGQMEKKGISNEASAKLIKKIGYPADYICEAVDQTRGWFYRLLATA